MTMRKKQRAFLLGLAASAAALALSGMAARAADPSGVWMVADQTATIRIAPCADGYWGVIDWERKPGTDTHNPDPAKRGQPLIGTPILIAMKPAGSNEWDGKVYNPQDGGFYNANISLERPDVLKLQGCMLIFCSDQRWTRVPDSARATTGAGAQTRPRRGATRPDSSNEERYSATASSPFSRGRPISAG